MTKENTLSKKAQLVELLERKDGATLDEIVKTTGWQGHSCRAAMTGLRKAGYTIDSGKADDVRRYRITAMPGDAK